MKPIEIVIYGIKCDAPGCGYEDLSKNWGATGIDFKKTADEFLNKLCPNCGASLLTQADYDSVLKMVGITDIVNDMFGDLPDGSPSVIVPVHMDGSGKIEIKRS